MEQHIEPLMNMLTSLMQRAQTLTNADIWPRRPLNFDKLSKSSKSASANKSKQKNNGNYQNAKSNDQVDEDRSINNGEEKQNPPSHGMERDKNQKQIDSIDPRSDDGKSQENDLLHSGDVLPRE